MAGKDKRGFHTVVEPSMEDYKHKLREHRLKVLKRTAAVTVAIILVFFLVSLFMALRHYENFDVTSSAERSDTDATKFSEFQGNILKYSNDGAFYTDSENELIWSQTYQMSDPQLDVCEDYIAIYDKKGTIVYIFTKDGLQGSVETTMPIGQACIAAQGTVALLMYKESAGYLALYDKSGTNLASGAIHGEKGGYPVAIALSHDAVKLAVSTLTFSDGSIKSTIAFYNYGSVGQNEIDNCVGVNTYPEMIIPEMEYTSGDRLVAYGDEEILIFEGSQKPQLANKIPLEKQARSIFHNEEYIGIVTSNEDENVTNHLTVYDTYGSQIMEEDFKADYTSIEFLANNEICIRSETVCDIYTLKGIYKFHYEFDKELYKVIRGTSGLNYTFVMSDTTEKIRLK